MKAVKIKLAGRERYLAFTGEAMFQIRDEYTGTAELLDTIKADTPEGYRTACAVAALLAEQGELARRHLGYDPAPMVTAEAIMRTTAPCEIAALKLAIPAAIALGYGREIVDENAEIDLGLAELNQKNDMTRAHYIRMAAAAGLSMKEAFLMAPGELYDAFELYLQSHGVKRKKSEEDF